MSKPKNRSVTFTRGPQPQPQPETEPPDATNEIPRASKQEIRHLIEERGATSTTEIANVLNEDGFPTATADKWTASLVDSALRRKDMEGLKERIRENRGEPDDAPSLLEIRQAAYDGAKEAVESGPKVRLPELPPVKLDTFAVKGAVADATNQVFQGFRKQIDEANGRAASTVAAQVQSAMTRLMTDSDLPAIRRVTNATGKNMGEVLKRIDGTCADLHDTVVDTLKEHGAAVVATSEAMAESLCEQVDQRFNVLEDKLIEKFTSGMNVDLDAALTRVVDARLKHHLDTVVNQFALMVDGLRRELAEERAKRKGRR